MPCVAFHKSKIRRIIMGIDWRDELSDRYKDKYHPGVITLGTLNEIAAEAYRAHIKHGDNSMLAPTMDDGDRLPVLVEEVGEVSRLMNELRIGNIAWPEYVRCMKEELTQVAAMAASWLEVRKGNFG
jgi:hypothetical protein